DWSPPPQSRSRNCAAPRPARRLRNDTASEPTPPRPKPFCGSAYRAGGYTAEVQRIHARRVAGAEERTDVVKTAHVIEQHANGELSHAFIGCCRRSYLKGDPLHLSTLLQDWPVRSSPAEYRKTPRRFPHS